jgi:hypothetical protein
MGHPFCWQKCAAERKKRNAGNTEKEGYRIENDDINNGKE